MRGLVIMLWLTGIAAADPQRSWHVGANLRTEQSTHAVRIDGGVRLCRLDLIGVIDPLVWTDGEMDLDALANWHVSDRGYGVLAGWRAATIGLADGRQVQETLLLGVTGPLPSFGPVELELGIELATVLVKHGGGVPTDVTSFGSSSQLGDNINVGMFLRVGYAHDL